MGEFFLTTGLVSIGVTIGMIFFIIPGMIIQLAWSLALLLVVDKGKNPAEALTMSNNCTYGNKWRMVGIYLLFAIAATIVSVIFGLIPVMGWFFVLITVILSLFIYIGLQASIYKQLAGSRE
jgi:uncharacterized membrane protein